MQPLFRVEGSKLVLGLELFYLKAARIFNLCLNQKNHGLKGFYSVLHRIVFNQISRYFGWISNVPQHTKEKQHNSLSPSQYLLPTSLKNFFINVEIFVIICWIFFINWISTWIHGKGHLLKSQKFSSKFHASIVFFFPSHFSHYKNPLK